MGKVEIIFKNYEHQTDAIRAIYKESKGNRDFTVKTYAELERKGLVKRDSNIHNWDAEAYAKRLFYTVADRTPRL